MRKPLVSKKNNPCYCGRTKNASFGDNINTLPTRCSVCKTDGMVNVRYLRAQRLCKCGLSHNPQYGYDTKICCSKCKSPDMLLLTRKKKCICGKVLPSFGFPGGRAQCCKSCKLDGMISLRGKKCQCGRAHATFGFPSDGKRICCRYCKTNEMVDVLNRRCMCGQTQPYMGYSESSPICCFRCASEDMQYTYGQCACGKCIASFGYKGGRPTHCNDCKEDTMVSIYGRICHCGKKFPIFAWPSEKTPTHCAACKCEGMIDVFNKRRKCEVCKEKRATYGMKDQLPTSCASCRTIDMVPIYLPICSIPDCPKFSAKDGFCTTCHPEYIPTTRSVSRIGCRWIDQLETELDTKIQHCHLGPHGIEGTEHRTHCLPRQPVDGYDGDKIIYEFLGDHFHGHPSLWPKEVNMYGARHCELFEKTDKKFSILSQHGYTVYYIWESDFKKYERDSNEKRLFSICRKYNGTLEY